MLISLGRFSMQLRTGSFPGELIGRANIEVTFLIFQSDMQISKEVEQTMSVISGHVSFVPQNTQDIRFQFDFSLVLRRPSAYCCILCNHKAQSK